MQNKTSTQTEEWHWKKHRLIIQRKPRYRGLKLAVLPCGDLKLTAALKTSSSAIEDFLKKSDFWLEKKLEFFEDLKKKHPRLDLVEGEKLLLLGRLRHLTIDEKISHVQLIDKDHLALPLKNRKESLHKFYKKMAQKLMPMIFKSVENKIGFRASTFNVKTYKARWGTCSSKGDISINWKLIAAPIPVIEYVMIHELCHMLEMSHSKKFWSHVEHFDPKYKDKVKWLRDQHYSFEFLEKKPELHI